MWCRKKNVKRCECIVGEGCLCGERNRVKEKILWRELGEKK